jgi:RHS repeat-associated protein
VLTVVSDRKIIQAANSTQTVLNNTFNGSSVDGWTPISSAVLSNSAAGALTIRVVRQMGAKQTLAVTPGQTYNLSFDLLASMAASLTLQVYNETSNTLISSIPISVLTCWPPPCSVSPVTYNITFTPTDNLVSFRLFQGGTIVPGPPPPGSPYNINIDNFKVTTASSGAITYVPDVISSTDYYPFGSPMPGRSFNTGSYKYTFNGKESDPETVGTGGGTQDYGFRIYNPSLGKFLSIDPLIRSFPELTPYQYASNNPIQNIDFDGLEGLAGNIVPMPLGGPFDANNDGKQSKSELKGGTKIMVATAALVVDAFITKGWIGATLGVYSFGEGVGNGEKALLAKKAGNLEAAAKYEEMSKEGYLGAAVAVGPGLLVKGTGALFKSVKSAMNALDRDGMAIVSDGNGNIAGSASINNGELNLSIKTTGTDFKGRGSDVFKTLYNFVNKNYDKVNAIRGTWRAGEMGSNMTQFNEYIGQGFSEVEAAAKTFTGTNASKLGFKNVKVENVVKDANGAYKSADVIFSK